VLTSLQWDTAPGLVADGSQIVGNTGVWSGAVNQTAVGTSGTTCNDWNSDFAGAGYGGRAGFSVMTGLMGLDPTNACFSTFINLVCFQQ
jgi:hypothetical protein